MLTWLEPNNRLALLAGDKDILIFTHLEDGAGGQPHVRSEIKKLKDLPKWLKN